jgi:hypothetical protein
MSQSPFDCTPDDLAQNRAGRVSERQVMTARADVERFRRRLFGLPLLLALVIGGGVALLVGDDLFAFFQWICAVQFAVAGSALAWRSLRADLVEWVPRLDDTVVAGEVEEITETSIRVGERWLSVSAAQAAYLTEQPVPLRVYYIERNERVIAAEPFT